MIIDVENPLLGIDGASLLFGEQKGATDEEAKMMEKGFVHLLDQLEVDDKTTGESQRCRRGNSRRDEDLFQCRGEIRR